MEEGKPIRKTLVFSQGIKMLDIIAGACELDGIPAISMTGQTQIVERRRLVYQFNQPDDPSEVFCLTTRVGGLGLTLTGACRVVIFDPDWNPSVDTQAAERVYRYGQTKAVSVYRMICRGTIEDRIVRRQIFKKVLASRILKGPTQLKRLSKNQLASLLSYEPRRRNKDSTKSSPGVKRERDGSPVRREREVRRERKGKANDDDLMALLPSSVPIRSAENGVISRPLIPSGAISALATELCELILDDIQVETDTVRLRKEQISALDDLFGPSDIPTADTDAVNMGALEGIDTAAADDLFGGGDLDLGVPTQEPTYGAEELIHTMDQDRRKDVANLLNSELCSLLRHVVQNNFATETEADLQLHMTGIHSIMDGRRLHRRVYETLFYPEVGGLQLKAEYYARLKRGQVEEAQASVPVSKRRPRAKRERM
ncbi:hypothetical protein KIPB_007239 [Kipferlia bialata]|uniref:Helicase C-terminal domain-containing protein n=1 Tax=Kipferlia bialata TaxID=797122 RepID=A0A9K3D008_9EUKA|nr:hypothetical protein KIPB_007239 [Kipferlia bialata]|eukprot:g7239.t1